MKTSLQKRQEAGAAFARAKAILEAAGKDNRDLTTEEQASFDGAMAEHDAAIRDAERLERFEAAGAAIAPAPPVVAPKSQVEVFGDLDLVGERPRCFKGEKARERAYASGQFIRATVGGNAQAATWCREHGVEIHAAQSSGTNTAGGYLIPKVMEGAVIEMREDRGLLRRYAMPIPMSSDNISQARNMDGVVAYPIGEAEAPTTSEIKVDLVGLTARKWGADVVVNNDLSDDAVISIADLVTRAAGWAFADAEDKCLFLGDGTSTYHGIVGIIATANDALHGNALYTAIGGNTAFSTLDDADLVAMLGKIASPAKRGGLRWFVSPEGKAASFDRLTRAAGGNTTAQLAAGQEQTYAGYPVTESEIMNSTLTAQTTTAGLVILANIDQAVMFGNRRGLTLFTNPYILGRQFQTVLTFSERFDLACPGMGNNTTTAGSADRRKSAAVVLKTPGS